VSFVVASWNILATAYIRREWYPRTPRRFLDPSWRLPAVAKHALALDADILCLQEVEASAYDAIDRVLAPAGYAGSHAPKGNGRPDGCAIFFRRGRFNLEHTSRLAYSDGAGGPDSGHILQLLILEQDGRRLALGNTHLKWDPPGAEASSRWGYRQAKLAVAALDEAAGSADRILCGDLNVTPESDVAALLTEAGFDYAHRGLQDVRTCNSNGQARLIDYLFFRGSLLATPLPTDIVEDMTPLPSSGQPSDHVPLAARFVQQLR
jgi:mRNA deadenylase 3'-5' endonuclease subunit Ccr4